MSLSLNTTIEFSADVSLNSGAAQVKLSTLVKNGIIRVGDIIAYRRSFANSEPIEKDTIVCFLPHLINVLFFFFFSNTLL